MLKWARVVAEAASVVDIAVNTSVSPHGGGCDSRRSRARGLVAPQ
jgi:hypothetical protein